MIAVRPQILYLFQKSGILLLHRYFQLNRCRNHKASKGSISGMVSESEDKRYFKQACFFPNINIMLLL